MKSSPDDVFFSTVEGNLQIVGRKKELSLRRGYNSFPREVEEILHTHEAVLEVAIVGIPDSVLGEVTCAFVKLKPNTQIESQVLLDFICDSVANDKVPNKLMIIDDFPMSASGKIKKMSLQKLLIESMKAELH